MSLVKVNRPNSWLGFPAWTQDILNSDSLINAVDTVGTMPAVNIKETEDEFILEFAAPGYKKSDFNIETKEGSLIVKGVKEQNATDNGAAYTKREFSYASFSRVFELPETVNEDKISATYSDGILSLELPKKEEAKPKSPRKVTVK